MPTFDWSQFTWPWLVTTLVAAYAAALSSWQAYVTWRDKRVHIRASLNSSMVLFSGPGTEPVDYISLNVSNHGFLAATYSQTCGSIHVKRGGTNRFIVPKPFSDVPNWPHTLQPGTSFFIGFEKDRLYPALRKAGHSFPVQVRGIATDQTGRETRTKWITLTDTET